MAGRREQDAAGIVTGVATALLTRRKKASAYELVAEALGGALGGGIGSRLLDFFEPAIHSYRNVVHSVAFAGTVTVKGTKRAARPQARLRAQADEFAERRTWHHGLFEWMVLWLAETACRVATGFIAGAIPGYLSHLALDAKTPRGIPLLSLASRNGDSGSDAHARCVRASGTVPSSRGMGCRTYEFNSPGGRDPLHPPHR